MVELAVTKKHTQWKTMLGFETRMYSNIGYGWPHSQPVELATMVDIEQCRLTRMTQENLQHYDQAETEGWWYCIWHIKLASVCTFTDLWRDFPLLHVSPSCVQRRLGSQYWWRAELSAWGSKRHRSTFCYVCCYPAKDYSSSIIHWQYYITAEGTTYGTACMHDKH